MYCCLLGGYSNEMAMPGVPCPTCAAKEQEVWVLAGKVCGYCCTPCG